MHIMLHAFYAWKEIDIKLDMKHVSHHSCGETIVTLIKSNITCNVSTT